MASEGGPPMGILASLSGEPVGWCACGPRSRYEVAAASPHGLLHTRPREDDDSVWLVPCLFVKRENRGQGITRALIRSALDVARDHGAVAVEGWPSDSGGFVGRERVFEDLGFVCVARPEPGRAIMRLELG